jgi:hypothetical protein
MRIKTRRIGISRHASISIASLYRKQQVSIYRRIAARDSIASNATSIGHRTERASVRDRYISIVSRHRIGEHIKTARIAKTRQVSSSIAS